MCAMLCVRGLSGQELARVPVEELSDVRSLKLLLNRLHGLPSRFRQRLLIRGSEASLADDEVLDTSMDLELVLIPFSCVSQTQVDELVAAARDGSLTKVESMLQVPQDPNLADKDGTTALVAASLGGHVEVIRVLLEGGANTDLAPNGIPPLLLACRRGDAKVVQMLLDAGADKDFINERGSALIAAASRGHVEVTHLLLEAGADKNADNGTTALVCASAWGELEAVSLLLEAGADIDMASSDDGDTALISATRQGHERVVRLLLEARANKDVTTREGKTALDLASDRADAGLVALLEGAVLNLATGLIQ